MAILVARNNMERQNHTVVVLTVGQWRFGSSVRRADNQWLACVSRLPLVKSGGSRGVTVPDEAFKS